MDSKVIDFLCRKNLEYLYMVSLISSDNILTKEDAEKSLSTIDEVLDAVDNSSVSVDKKNELKKYLEEGKDILNQDIERFNER